MPPNENDGAEEVLVPVLKPPKVPKPLEVVAAGVPKPPNPCEQKETVKRLLT